MDVVVVGGHGQIALQLLRLLASRGDSARGVVRNPDHVADLEGAGATAIVHDIEANDGESLARAIGTADAIVFAAGAGPGSGPERKLTVDLGGAVKSVEAARLNGIRRFLIVSSISAHLYPEGNEGMAPYIRAKHDADEAVIASGLDYTIVRPGSLTDEPPTGQIRIETEFGNRADVPRADVAATLLACLDDDGTVGKIFELFEGDQPIADALRALS